MDGDAPSVACVAWRISNGQLRLAIFPSLPGPSVNKELVRQTRELRLKRIFQSLGDSPDRLQALKNNYFGWTEYGHCAETLSLL